MKSKHLFFWLLLLIAGHATAQTASLVKDIYPLATGSTAGSLAGVSIGNKLLFAADNSVNGNELWISDGTDAGTTLLKDVFPGSRTTSSTPRSFFTHRGIVYFYVNLGGFSTPFELWRSDGTTNGTFKIGDEETVNNQLVVVDTALYFISGNGLIKKDLLKAGYTTIIDRSYNSDISQFPTTSSQITRLGTNWLFTASSVQSRSRAIYLSDATKPGTKRVATLGTTDSEITATRSGKLAFFANDDGALGAELWMTDGTTAGTKMVKNIAPGGLSSFNSLASFSIDYYPISPLQDGVMFVANDGVTGNELWISDGTEAGTKIFKEFTPGSGGTSFNFFNLGDNLIYFTVNNQQLWRTDGTTDGTYMLANTGTYAYIRKEGNFIYYLNNDNKIYRLDGQPNSSQVVGTATNILNGSFSGLGNFHIAGNNIFYAGYTDAAGFELWKLPFCDHQATIAAPVGASFCTGASIDLQANGSGGAGPFTYKWTSGSSNLGTNAKLTVDKTGTYTVDVTDSKGCTVSTSIEASETKNLPVGISGPTAYCAGTSVPLSSTVAGGTAPYTYQWKQNSGNISGATSTTLSVNTTGTYSLSVADSKGCTGTSAGLSISQKPTPTATIAASGPTVVAPGASLSVILTTPAATGQTYQWSRDGQAIAGATNNTYLATQAGDYTVFVNRDGCTATSSVTRLAVGLAIGITGQPNFCIGSSTTLVVTATTGDAPYTYQWRLGNTVVSTTNTLTVSTAGTYSVTVTDSKGVVGTLPAVVVTQRPVPEATISASGPLILQPGASVVLRAPVVAGQTYQWFRNGQAIAGVTGNDYTANQAGDYTVTVTRDGCSATSVPTRVSLALQAAITGANLICAGQSTTLVAGNTNGDGPFTYQWRLNGAVQNVVGNTLIVNAPGSYAVTITDSKGQIGVSAAFNVTQKPAPNTAITVVGQIPLQPGTSAVLSVVAVPSQTYQWLNDNQSISGATTNSLTVTQAGKYAVTINRDGCTATSAITEISLITALEPGPTGIGMEISPNPTADVCTVKLLLDKAAQAQVSLLDAGGKSVREWASGRVARSHEAVLSLVDLPAGLYFVQAVANDKKSVMKLIRY